MIKRRTRGIDEGLAPGQRLRLGWRLRLQHLRRHAAEQRRLQPGEAAARGAAAEADEEDAPPPLRHQRRRVELPHAHAVPRAAELAPHLGEGAPLSLAELRSTLAERGRLGVLAELKERGLALGDRQAVANALSRSVRGQ